MTKDEKIWAIDYYYKQLNINLTLYKVALEEKNDFYIDYYKERLKAIRKKLKNLGYFKGVLL